MSTTRRLHEAILLAAPITGVSVGRMGHSSTVQVQPPELQEQAQPTIDAFDWGEAAHDAWVASRNPEKLALRELVAFAVAGNNEFLALSNAAAQNQAVAQIRSLTRQCSVLLKRLAQIQ